MKGLDRVHRLATRVGVALSGGAGLGLLARDLAGLPAPAVAVAWVAGAILGLFGLGRS